MDIEQIVQQVMKELKSRHGTPEQTRSADFDDEREMGVENPHNEDTIRHAQSITPARIGIGRAGTRMRTKSYLQFRIDHAAAQDAVRKDVSEAFIEQLNLPKLDTKAGDMKTYLMDLDAGRTLSDKSAAWLEKNGDKGKQVQIVVCDGLSSSAVEANAGDLLPALMQGLKLKNISVAKPVFVKRGRVWVQDEIARIVDCDLVISLIGERPGLNTDESLSAYMIYRPTDKTVEADRTVISNIHKGGLTPVEAGAHLSGLISKMIESKCTGVAFARKNNLNFE